MKKETQLLIKLIDDDMVNVNALLIKNYRGLHITEKDIIVLSMLSRQEIKGNHVFSSKNMSKKIGLEIDDFCSSIEKLENRNFIKIEEGTSPKTGKIVEYFYLDGFYDELAELYLEKIRKENEQKNQSFEEEITNLFERTFERPLTVSDADIIRKWSMEEEYKQEEIKTEILAAAKVGKFSLKYVDSKLVKKHIETENNKEYTNQSTVIKELSEKWKK